MRESTELSLINKNLLIKLDVDMLYFPRGLLHHIFTLHSFFGCIMYWHPAHEASNNNDNNVTKTLSVTSTRGTNDCTSRVVEKRLLSRLNLRTKKVRHHPASSRSMIDGDEMA